MIKLDAKELRTTIADPEIAKKLKKNPIFIICDNVIDTYNIGSIFRLADAVAAEKVFLCGVSETPPNTRIKKASINTTEWVSWEYFDKTEDAIKDLRQKFSTKSVILSESEGSHSINKLSIKRDSSTASQNDIIKSGIQIIAIEQDQKSIPFDKAEYDLPVAFVVGNETTGCPKEVLDLCDQIVEIPMWGVNKSLNVMVSLGIVLFNSASKMLSEEKS